MQSKYDTRPMVLAIVGGIAAALVLHVLHSPLATTVLHSVVQGKPSSQTLKGVFGGQNGRVSENMVYSPSIVLGSLDSASSGGWFMNTVLLNTVLVDTVILGTLVVETLLLCGDGKEVTLDSVSAGVVDGWTVGSVGSDMVRDSWFVDGTPVVDGWFVDCEGAVTFHLPLPPRALNAQI